MTQKVMERITQLLHPLRRWWAGRVVRRKEPTGILFVCQGNLCRSPYAAGLLNNFTRFGDRDLDVTSAGFMTEIPTPPALAIDVAASRGVDLKDHTAQLITRALVTNSDLIVVMEARQKKRVERIFRGDMAPVILLGDLDPQMWDSRDIADPILKPRDFLNLTYERIDRCVAELARMTCGLTEEEAARVLHHRNNLSQQSEARTR